jgi:hypothetical protein
MGLASIPLRRREGVKELKNVLTSDIAMVYCLPQLKEASMGYLSKLQVIERAKGQRQFYLICPAPLAQALEMEKGETLEWIVEDKWTLTVKRIEADSGPVQRRRRHGKG